MKKHVCLFLAILIWLIVCVYAGEEAVKLETEKGVIHGTLILPEKLKIPVVILIAGSGPTDRNGNQPGLRMDTLRLLAEGLRENNIASLRFDKRMVGESIIPDFREADLRFEHYVRDVRDWVRLLSEDGRFSGIIVAGHSEGSLIGLLASIDNDMVAGFISVAGAGRPIDKVLREQLSRQPKQITELTDIIIDSLKKGEMVDDINPILYSLFRPSVQPYLISWFKYNPQDEIKKLKIPILIIQGTTDIQSSVRDAELLGEANPEAVLRIIENMNHVLRDCREKDLQIQLRTYNDPDLPLNGEIVDEIVSFIKGMEKAHK